METAICVHCGIRGIVKRDGRGAIIEQRCVHGHTFEFSETETRVTREGGDQTVRRKVRAAD